MEKILLSPPLLGFIVGTRAALGVGVGLMIAGRIPESRRRALGMKLITIGAATTIPALVAVIRARAAEKRLHA
jgi:hypothetical protein